MRVTFVTCGLEHLGSEALSAWVRPGRNAPALARRCWSPVIDGGRAHSRGTARTMTCIG